jgi:hypothetical protein
MEGVVLAVSALRRDYRDCITPLSSTAVHRKNVDNDMLADSCYIRLRGWEIGEEVTTIRVGAHPGHTRPVWPSPFSRRAAVLARAAADGATEKVRRLLENGSSILHETFSRRGEECRRDMGVAFTALGGPRPVRYLGLNLMNSFPGVGVVAISLLSHPW